MATGHKLDDLGPTMAIPIDRGNGPTNVSATSTRFGRNWSFEAWPALDWMRPCTLGAYSSLVPEPLRTNVA